MAVEILVALLAAAEIAPDILHRPEGAVRGAAMIDGRVISWGDGVVSWPLDGGAPRVLSAAKFDEGGCGFGGGLVVQEAPPASGALGRMVWLRDGKLEPIDTESDFRDCVAATLFGRRGVLAIHRQVQVRFHEPPPRAGGANAGEANADRAKWSYREIYSIYTPSRQGGLLVEDVDGDRRPDILCGNYWIRSPARFELPWRLFAIGNWWEDADSAMLRLASRLAPGLIAAQRELAPARIAWFDKPADPTQFWMERRVAIDPPLRYPRVLTAGPEPGTAIAGEDAGPGSRLLLIRRDGAVQAIGRGDGFVEGWTVNGSIVTVERHAIARWRFQRRR